MKQVNKPLNFFITYSSKQSGMTLFVSMIMLFVMTILGLSTIGSTTLGVQMAANNQFENIVFQESEDAIETSADDINYLGSAYTASVISSTPSWPTNTVETASSSNNYLSSSSQAKFIGFANPKGESAGSIRMGMSGYQLYNYEIRGTASLANNNAENTNVQGAYIIGARFN